MTWGGNDHLKTHTGFGHKNRFIKTCNCKGEQLCSVNDVKRVALTEHDRVEEQTGKDIGFNIQTFGLYKYLEQTTKIRIVNAVSSIGNGEICRLP